MREKGFTLVELLIVIAIIAVLAAVVFVALDPAKRFAEARNSTRWEEADSILSAVLKYQVDNVGNLPTGISTDLQMLGTATSGCDVTCSASTSLESFVDQSQADFLAGTLNNVTWDTDHLELNSTLTGDFTSQVFDTTVTDPSYGNISWQENLSVTAPQIISNWDLENYSGSGNSANWDNWNEYRNNILLEPDTGYNSATSARFTNQPGNSYGYLYQYIPGIQGSEDYNFSFWEKGDITGVNLFLRDSAGRWYNFTTHTWGGFTWNAVTNHADWTQFTETITTEAGVTAFWLYVYVYLPTGNTFNIDQISLTQVPDVDITVQARSGNTNPPAGSFVGPDGTSGTYFTDPLGEALNLATDQYYQYQVNFSSNSASYSPTLSKVTTNYSRQGTTSTQAACLNLRPELIDYYLTSMPEDPSEGSDERTYYAIRKTPSGRITVEACGAESDEFIYAER